MYVGSIHAVPGLPAYLLISSAHFCCSLLHLPSLPSLPYLSSAPPLLTAVPNRDAYRAWVLQFTARGFDLPVQHTSSPIVWSEEPPTDDDDMKMDMKTDMKVDRDEGKATEGKDYSDSKGDDDDVVIDIPNRRRTYHGGCDWTLDWLKDQVAPRRSVSDKAMAADLAIDCEVCWDRVC